MQGRERLKAIVRGHVQGVGFRYFTMRWARELSLSGYVRNRPDRTVEVVAEGERGALEELLARLNRGPRGAVVSDVEAIWQQATGEFRDFQPRF